MSAHKPKRHDKTSKAILESLQEAQKTTQAIKSELMEHNNIIKLHSSDVRPPKPSDEEEDKPAIRVQNKIQNENIQKRIFSEKSLQTLKSFPAQIGDTTGEEKKNKETLPVTDTDSVHEVRKLMEQWVDMQFAFMRFALDGMSIMLRMKKEPLSQDNNFV